MDYTVALLSIAGAMVIGAMSPGPSFLMVARTAVASSCAHGVAAALGMGAGGVLFALAALLPRAVPAWFFAAVPLIVFAIETGWYSIVAFALSTAAPRAAYLRYKVWIDRAAGGVMAMLGVKLVASAADV
jgi:threonine/homoserine/homoserine lactone efflux protein